MNGSGKIGRGRTDHASFDAAGCRAFGARRKTRTTKSCTIVGGSA